MVILTAAHRTKTFKKRVPNHENKPSCIVTIVLCNTSVGWWQHLNHASHNTRHSGLPRDLYVSFSHVGDSDIMKGLVLEEGWKGRLVLETSNKS